MQGQVKIPKLHSKTPLLPHFTDTMKTTNILSIQAYCLDLMHDFFSLQRLLFFCISLIKWVFSLPSILPSQALIISHLNFYSLCCALKKINCIQSNTPITSQSINAQPLFLSCQMFKQVYQSSLCPLTSEIFLLNTQRTTSLTSIVCPFSLLLWYLYRLFSAYNHGQST